MKNRKYTEPSPVLPDHATIITQSTKDELYYAGHSSNRYKYPVSSQIYKGKRLYIENLLIYKIRNNAK